MSYDRTPQPQIIATSRATTVVRFTGEREIAGVLHANDPFGIDDRCAFNPTGQHYGTGSCGDVVCCYCSRVFWR